MSLNHKYLKIQNQFIPLKDITKLYKSEHYPYTLQEYHSKEMLDYKQYNLTISFITGEEVKLTFEDDENRTICVDFLSQYLITNYIDFEDLKKNENEPE